MTAAAKNVEDFYPLSPLQAGMLFHTLEAPGEGLYCEQMACALEGELDTAAFHHAWQALVDRHPVLRSAIVWKKVKEPVQVVRKQVEVEVEELDWRPLPSAEQERLFTQLVEGGRRRDFDLSRPPLVRLALVRTGEAAHRFIWSFHHIILDGWSVLVLLEELFTLYRGFQRGREPDLPTPRPFRDYIAWLRRRDPAAAEGFWRRTLEGFSEPAEVAVGRWPGGPAGRVGEVRAALTPAASEALTAFARARGLTANIVAQGAWALLLARLTGRRDVVFGVTVSGRPPDLAGVERMVGLFINTVPLAVEVGDGEEVAPWLARLQRRQGEVMAHAHAPLAEIQGWSPVPRGRPLFDTLLVFENAASASTLTTAAGGELAIRVLDVPAPGKYPLTAVVAPGPPLGVHLGYDPVRFTATAARRLARGWCRLVEAMAASPDARLGDLPILGAAEHHQLLFEANDTAAVFPPEATLGELLRRQAEAAPEAVAVVGEGEHLSYGALVARAGALAARLRELGVGPETPVGLGLGRSPQAVVATAAVTLAGGAYLPLDPSYPSERLALLLADAGAPVVITEEAHRPALAAAAEAARGSGARGSGAQTAGMVEPRFVLLESLAAVQGDGVPAPTLTPGPDALAYVMYTSGSTGVPKGVAATHRGVVRLVRSGLSGSQGPGSFARLDASTTLVALAPLAFDASTLELWGPLLNGGRVVLGPLEAPSPRELGDLLARHRATTLWLTAGLFQRLAEAAPEALAPLSELLAGGDVLPPSAVERVQGRLPRLAVINGYGPTENTTFTCCHRVVPGEAAAGPVPIGRPIAGTTVYVLDATGRPVPPGVAGELAAGGAGLARGYFLRPALTAAAFVPDAVSGEAGGRLYLTGDRVRRLPDGRLDFLGRVDQQLKVRGFRIEPGEVEVTLAEHPAVAQAAVVPWGEGAGGRRLAAFVVLRSGEAEGAAGEGGGDALAAALRDFLSARLPEPMVPAAFRVVDELPLTPQGKVDRRRLATAGPTAGAPGAAGRTPPRNEDESAVAAVWGEVLGLDEVDVEEDFFLAGGHSLLAMQLVNRLQSHCGVEISLRAVLEGGTVASLAAAVVAARRAGEGVTQSAARQRAEDELRTAPLSFSQERLWFLDQLQPGSPYYNIPSALRLRGSLNLGAFAAALDEVTRRHETLRTTFATEEGSPVQVVHARPSRRLAWVDLAVVDLAALALEDREPTLAAVARADARSPFDLGRGPLLRVRLLATEPEERTLLLTMHHIISDGWSMGIFVREVVTAYAAYAAGETPQLPPLGNQYADFAVWQRETMTPERMEADLAYWRRQLADLPPVLELPTDRPRPAERRYRGDAVTAYLPAAGWQAMGALCREAGATLFMGLQAAFKVLLARTTGRRDLAVGSPIAGRSRGEVADLIGFFVNTLVLRTDLRGEPDLPELLARERKVALDAFSHQELPFERLVAELAPNRGLAVSPLFQVMFALQNAGVSATGLGELEFQPLQLPTGTAKFDLTLILMEGERGPFAFLEYDTDLFDRATARRLLGHYSRLLEALTSAPGAPVMAAPFLSAAEIQQLACEWSDRERPFPREATVAGLVAEAVAARPEAVAVVAGNEHLSYGELDRRARRLGRHLRGLGVGPEVLTGVCLERSPEMVVALLAVLEAGGAYLPLDPDYPQDRLAFLLADTGATVVVTSGELAGRLPAGAGGTPLHPVLLDAFWGGGRAGAHEGGGPGDARWGAGIGAGWGAGAQALAYVSYTSGSTGKPKGVAVSHRSVARLVRGAEYAAFGPRQTVLHLAPVAFDASTFEIWGPLANGGRLVLAPPGPLSLAELAHLLERHRVRSLFLTTALFQQLVEEELPALEPLAELLTGGEAVPARPVRQVVAAHPALALANVYGPTESTTFTTWGPVGRGPVADSVPIGRPIANTRVHLLDPGGLPAPVGVGGELVIGGEGLARGYWARPAATAAAFVPDGVTGRPGDRLYRTGDLVRFLPDGRLDFLGRIDRQVKLRGFRVEPGEIEAVLGAHPAVRRAVVLVREDAPGDRRLVAYAVTDDGAEGHAGMEGELAAHLAERLPAYMQPAAVMQVAELPLTATGKVDRRALPAPAVWVAAEDQPSVPPRTPVEEILADIWGHVLGCGTVGIHDSFFELGGHSLLATKAVSRIREVLGVELPLRDFFEAPTVAAAAARVEELRRRAASAPAAIEAQPRGEREPASLAQRRLWFLHQLDPSSPAYNMPVALRFRGLLAPAVLAAALTEVVRRHETLRTTFRRGGGEPVQVLGAPVPWTLPVVDLSALPAADRRRTSGALTHREAQRPFDLERGPLLRTTLLRLGAVEEEQGEGGGEAHDALLTIHHIVSDGWSLGVLVREVAELYSAYVQGRPSPLPELAVQYADYARWQRRTLSGENLDRQLAYWRGQLGGPPTTLDLPTDHPRPRVQSFHGASCHRSLPPRLSDALRELGRRGGATLFMVLLAAFKVLVARHAGRAQVRVGTPIAGRGRQEIEGLIGFFVNTLVLATDLSGEPTFQDLVERVREVALGAYAHQDVPFEKLVEELQPERDLSRTPLFQLFFNMVNLPRVEAGFPGLTLEAVPQPSVPAKFDLTVYATDEPEGIHLEWVYNGDLFDDARMAGMLEQYRHLLEQVAARPDRPVTSYSLLTPSSSALLPDPEAQLAASWPGSVAAAFRRQARSHPHRLALSEVGRAWSYGALAAAVAATARRLAAAGVGRGAVVAVYAPRSAELVLGVLATLEAGGAFLILDPAYPPPRLAEVVADARPRAWLAAAAVAPPAELAAALAAAGAARLELSAEGASGAPEAREAARHREVESPAVEPPDAEPEELAYVAFTSGSTGRAKGILGPHGPLAHFIHWHATTHGFTAEDRFSLLSGLAHDPLLRDLFTPLWVGGVLAIPEAGEWATPGWLADWMAAQAVTVCHLTPAMTRLLAVRGRRWRSTGEPPRLGALSWAFFAGDRLTGEDLDRLRLLAPEAAVVNLYGATETPQGMGYHRLDGATPATALRGATVPLGRGIDGVQLLVLGRAGALAGVGEVGEIAVRTPYLATGYLGDPAATAQRFVPTAGGGRLYRTGDLGRFRLDGAVEYAGRADRQVKVRGYRVEPAEIEGLLRAEDGVEAAVVKLWHPGDGPATSDEARLAAYFVAGDGAAVEVEDLMAALRRRLPEYMVPAFIMPLAELPLTPNGKVDLGALPDPADARAALGREAAPPRNQQERAIAGIWRQVLGLAEVGIHDRFFDLGGSSLHLVEVRARLEEELGREIPLPDLFNHPTVASLATHLSAAGQGEADTLRQAEERAEQVTAAKARRRQQLARRRSAADGGLDDV